MRGLGELALTELPVPTPGPRDVLIRTLAATICASDLHEIVTHAIPFERWPEAFALARDGHDRALKVALTFAEAT
jgi:threonine dehydrogenase-like Zn-dependent dehydrogenase